MKATSFGSEDQSYVMFSSFTYGLRVCSFDSRPEKEFTLKKIGKSVRLNQYYHSGKLGISSKLFAPGALEKLKSLRKMSLSASFFSKPENAFC